MSTWGLSRSPRFGAAALALAITAALLSALQGSRIHRVDGPLRTVTVWLTPLAPQLSAASEMQARRERHATRRSDRTNAEQAPRREPADLSTAASQPAEERRASPAIADAPRGAAPLNLELQGAAARAASSPLRSLAEKTGTYMGDERLSEQGRLAQSVTRAAKAYCLASNEHGSLLSIFKIAYDAVTDRCK